MSGTGLFIQHYTLRETTAALRENRDPESWHS